MKITNKLSWFVESLIDKILEHLFQPVNELFISSETNENDVVQLLHAIQQLLKQCFVFGGDVFST